MNSHQIAFEKRLITLFAFWLFLALLLCSYWPEHASTFFVVTAGYLLFAEVKANRQDRAEEERECRFQADLLMASLGASVYR